MTPPRPVPQHLVPQIPATYTADIVTHDGIWFRYRVSRQHGIGIPENSLSFHRSLRGARRAARRWTQRNTRPEPVAVERMGEPKPTGIANL